MNIEVKNIPVPQVTCANCQACCCSLEVRIISDTGVPHRHIYIDDHGHESMLRLDDGLCSALNRDTLLCSIYENRPWVCREFEMGSYECIDERTEKLYTSVNN
ncbi:MULTISPECIES: YkgJ family cysteine cluster protein [unclassified Colwellia]|jgi:Fe-S-cluster containining protein|uniref:YkgJ family cysteine cluster protein n=1 Tax=unclassified Colwellia TaxID=196834 RepID=UPI0015F5E38E|nr:MULTISPECIES: YkgJ family cysteine cluster protein [unclassified Colwellia]MBA6231659.1 YkgJ family cysteine cluster protein [Colwellia sp. MB02u-7]MBA6235523.1 YkgJ family cysteine cluster protein [Colwellia sp. MB02u-11]MBA6258077.1 YkgJ family cysteine cluster protein [Colwellia sp. MB3u-28]MBA6259771.1 YkgJ family cysteine cluster protein [Colwellia sp. MB3u-41]MBA6264437.1 YkgJ family cysteine cluster protein [Colwellia sp. Bg11-12]